MKWLQAGSLTVDSRFAFSCEPVDEVWRLEGWGPELLVARSMVTGKGMRLSDETMVCVSEEVFGPFKLVIDTGAFSVSAEAPPLEERIGS